MEFMKIYFDLLQMLGKLYSLELDLRDGIIQKFWELMLVKTNLVSWKVK